jgi:hypothetical protein
MPKVGHFDLVDRVWGANNRRSAPVEVKTTLEDSCACLYAVLYKVEHVLSPNKVVLRYQYNLLTDVTKECSTKGHVCYMRTYMRRLNEPFFRAALQSCRSWQC